MLLHALTCSRCGRRTNTRNSILRYYHGQQVRTCRRCLEEGALFVSPDLIADSILRQLASGPRNTMADYYAKEPVMLTDEEMTRERMDAELLDRADMPDVVPHADRITRAVLLLGFLALLWWITGPIAERLAR